MGDVVNLRLARKQTARREREAAAAENRARHGVSKAERDRQARLKLLQNSALDGHQRASKPEPE